MEEDISDQVSRAGGEGHTQGDHHLSPLEAQHGSQLQQEEHDMYYGEDADTRMTHLIHSDTMIVVIALVVMIVLGLIFRSLCMRLTSAKARKARMRGGLKALADHMHVVTKSMSNDLEQPDSPKAVMRTYSNYGKTRGREEERREGAGGGGKAPPVRHMSRENLRVQAFSNILAMEGMARPGQVSIEMAQSLPVPGHRGR